VRLSGPSRGAALLATLLLAGWAGAESATTKERARLRQGPSAATELLGEVDAGTTLELLGESGGWRQVRTPDGKTGWVWSEHLGARPDEPKPTEPARPAPPPRASADDIRDLRDDVRALRERPEPASDSRARSATSRVGSTIGSCPPPSRPTRRATAPARSGPYCSPPARRWASRRAACSSVAAIDGSADAYGSEARVAAVLVVLGYLAGCVPSGLLLGRRAGIDVRRSGSGNIGATNVARSAGAVLGLATLVADAAKGALPVLLARTLDGRPAVATAAGVAAFLGHVFPVTLRFAGGKGVATALGVLLVISPLVAVCALGVFALAFLLTRYVSLASVLAAILVPIATAALGYPRSTLAAGVVMSAIIVVRHRENVARLRAGTEPRFALPKK
jgi:glycerol-3-phosphate acyltransferase PlsY